MPRPRWTIPITRKSRSRARPRGCRMSTALNLTPEDMLDARASMARRDLLPFIQFMMRDYKVSWFHELVARKLVRFLDDAMHQRSPRLMIWAPPRCGKSELVNRQFPAWAFGKYPDMSIISASNANELASDMNLSVQAIMDSDEYARVFPSTYLYGKYGRSRMDPARRNSDLFEVVGHRGRYKSAGVGTSITGRGAHVLIVDDPVKDGVEAE